MLAAGMLAREHLCPCAPGLLWYASAVLGPALRRLSSSPEPDGLGPEEQPRNHNNGLILVYRFPKAKKHVNLPRFAPMITALKKRALPEPSASGNKSSYHDVYAMLYAHSPPPCRCVLKLWWWRRRFLYDDKENVSYFYTLVECDPHPVCMFLTFEGRQPSNAAALLVCGSRACCCCCARW